MHPVMPIQIPNKKRGAHYTVSFDSPELRHIPYGEVGSFPTPDLGQQCVCCNAPTDGRLVNTRPLDMSQSFVASQVPVPCCTACDDHLPIEAGATMKAVGMMFAGLVVVPLLLAAWFTEEGSPLALVAMAGVAAMICGAGALWLRLIRHREMASLQGGHHPGLELTAMPGLFAIRTRNRVWIERLVAAGDPHLSRIA